MGTEPTPTPTPDPNAPAVPMPDPSPAPATPMPDTSPPGALDPNAPEEAEELEDVEGERYDGGEIPRTGSDVDPEG
jgi:hypothetical protein